MFIDINFVTSIGLQIILFCYSNFSECVAVYAIITELVKQLKATKNNQMNNMLPQMLPQDMKVIHLYYYGDSKIIIKKSG